MGRELKRVPLDFDHPLDEIWPGYLTEDQDDPPEGPGYQMWETTSEGSPSTPVFETLRDLAVYCEKHCTTFASYRANAAEWESMLDADFVRHDTGCGVIFI